VVLGGAVVPFLGHRDYVVFGQSMDASIATADLAEGIGGFALDQPFEAHRAYHVAMLDDVNGDGYADIGVGAPIVGQYAPEAGRTYVILGGNFTGSVTQSGTEDVDALVGTASDDAFVAGRSNDSLVGAGGADVLYCGPEDDVVEIVDAAFARIDGGTGEDTLAWQASGATLDLSVLPDDVIVGIEIIDITGSGDNGLVLELRDLLWISGTSHTLTVTGDLGDALEADLVGGGFVDLGSAGGFTEYGNGVSTVLVSDALASTVAL
jgi:hypothetical protein